MENTLLMKLNAVLAEEGFQPARSEPTDHTHTLVATREGLSVFIYLTDVAQAKNRPATALVVGPAQPSIGNLLVPVVPLGNAGPQV